MTDDKLRAALDLFEQSDREQNVHKFRQGMDVLRAALAASATDEPTSPFESHHEAWMRRAARPAAAPALDWWTPQHLPACAMQDDDADCICGVGPEYERLLALAASATDEGPRPGCGCTFDSSEPNGVCPQCHHREHGTSGCPAVEPPGARAALAASATDEGPHYLGDGRCVDVHGAWTHRTWEAARPAGPWCASNTAVSRSSSSAGTVTVFGKTPRDAALSPKEPTE